MMPRFSRCETAYKKELRDNRKLHFKSHFESVLLQAGVDSSVMKLAVLRDLKNLQNRTRGRLFEVMGEVVTFDTFGERLAVTSWPPDRQRRFETPFGQRRVDLYYPAAKLIVEIKSGYITCSKGVREQIAKDRWIKDNSRDVNSIAWILFRGASQRAIGLLDRSLIDWLDVEYAEQLGEKSFDSCQSTQH